MYGEDTMGDASRQSGLRALFLSRILASLLIALPAAAAGTAWAQSNPMPLINQPLVPDAVALAQSFRTLFNFDSADGDLPFAGLIQATDGNLWGTTGYGGADNGCVSGCGTIFKITTNGELTTTHSFAGYPTEGSSPAAALIQGTDGNFYGTTFLGGDECEAGGGCGTVFRMTPSGTLTTLYSFCSHTNCVDGVFPEAGLIEGSSGNFYGTTNEGGVNADCNGVGCGTVFRITPTGTLTVLYNFCSQSNCVDGSRPWAGLLEASDGNFYGTAGAGGANGYGTVFKITPAGQLTVLYSFCADGGCSDGAEPEAGLIQATDGNLYGTTYGGGAHQDGTVFKITMQGVLTTLYSFCTQTNCSDGYFPADALVQATDGEFYGTTPGAGLLNQAKGTIFRITSTGSFTTLHAFCSQDDCQNGAAPLGALIQETNGRLYGVASDGGLGSECAGGCGTIFGLSVNLAPFIEPQPSFGVVGSTVKILGNSLKGATNVTFNGTPATFGIKGPALIVTTVPAGATTGTVQVVTPGGTLSSNVPFRVVQ